MKILFLDLSESDTPGNLGNKGSGFLRKANNQVKIINLQKYALMYKSDPSSLDGDSEFQRILREIQGDRDFDKLYLAAHGKIGNIKNLYSDFLGEGQKAILTIEQYSEMISRLLSVVQPRHLEIEFVVCHGARTEEDIDHIMESDPGKFMHTLAGRFLEAFHDKTHRKFELHLAAYTGRVSFDEDRGDILGETETQVLASSILEGAQKLLEGLTAQIGILERDAEKETHKLPIGEELLNRIDRLYEQFEITKNQITALDRFLENKPREYGKILFAGSEEGITVDLSSRESGAVNVEVEIPLACLPDFRILPGSSIGNQQDRVVDHLFREDGGGGPSGLATQDDPSRLLSVDSSASRPAADTSEDRRGAQASKCCVLL